jgi:hypothetical protein
MENTENAGNLTSSTEKIFIQVKNELKTILEFLKTRISAIDYTRKSETLKIATEFITKIDPEIEWKVTTVNETTTLKILQYVLINIQALYDYINKRICMNLGYPDKIQDFHAKNNLLVKYLEILIGKLDVQYEYQISIYNLYLFEMLYSFITEAFSIKDTSK